MAFNPREGALEEAPGHTAVLGMVTHETLLAYIADHFVSAGSSPSDLFPAPIGASGIGTWGDRLVALTYDSPLVHVLQLQTERNISSVPLVHPATGELMDIWGREDVLFVTHDPSLKCLDLPVHITRSAQLVAAAGATGLRVCSAEDPVGAVIETFTAARVRRVVAVDDDGKPIGIVTLSDIFNHLIQAIRAQ
jgi:CBS domain-containing protein